MFNLRILRTERGLLQKDVAQALNCTASCISSWEKGITEPNLNDLVKLAQFFECSIDYILGIENEDGVIVMSDTLSSDDKNLLDDYHSLSPAGQAKARGYIEGLKSAPEYLRTNKSVNY